MRIILNPSPFNEKLDNIDLNKLFCVILNEVEAKCFSGFDDYEKSMAYFKNTYPDLKIMMTLGNRGCIYGDKFRILYQPAFQVDVVDTTGAGDTFTGYFVAGLAFGNSIDKVIKNATAAASLSVAKNGAAPSIPLMNEVEDSLKILKQSQKIRKDVIKKMEAYIEENLLEANLDGLAQFLGYSTVYTGNLIKKLTGESFSKNLQEKRCRVASQLLLETDLSVEEVIRKVGYENGSFFRKIFRQMYGVNLLEYRKKRGIK